MPRPAANDSRHLAGSSPRHVVVMPFIGERVGGSHLSALLLWQGLQNTAFEPMIVVHREGLLTEHLTARRIPWRLVPLRRFVGDRATPSGYASAALSCARPLVSFLRDVEAAIVHTNDLRMHMSWALPARLAGVRQLWHQRTVFARSRSTRIAARLAHRFACISTFCLQGLPTSCRARGRVIHNPIAAERNPDRAAARRMLIDELGISAESSIVLFVGNLQAQKRPFVFVDAAARVASDLGKPVVFAILGADKEGLMPAARQSAAEHGIDLRFLGFRHPPEPWIAAADVLLAPSVDEGFGRTLVEAMQVGTPVVAARSGGHPEVVRDGATGFLVPVDDAPTMARVAVQVLTNPGSAEIASAARREVDGRYSIERHVAAVTALYGEMLDAK